jgi:hypothetical protein
MARVSYKVGHRVSASTIRRILKALKIPLGSVAKLGPSRHDYHTLSHDRRPRGWRQSARPPVGAADTRSARREPFRDRDYIVEVHHGGFSADSSQVGHVADGLRFDVRGPLLPGLVWPVPVVVDHVLAQHQGQVALAEDQHPVQQLPVQGPDVS